MTLQGGDVSPDLGISGPSPPLSYRNDVRGHLSPDQGTTNLPCFTVSLARPAP